MNRVLRDSPGPDYALELSLDDGTWGIINLSPRLFGPVFEPLKDPVLFS